MFTKLQIFKSVNYGFDYRNDGTKKKQYHKQTERTVHYQSCHIHTYTHAQCPNQSQTVLILPVSCIPVFIPVYQVQVFFSTFRTVCIQQFDIPHTFTCAANKRTVT